MSMLNEFLDNLFRFWHFAKKNYVNLTLQHAMYAFHMCVPMLALLGDVKAVQF